jgi:hypothetical protein
MKKLLLYKLIIIVLSICSLSLFCQTNNNHNNNSNDIWYSKFVVSYTHSDYLSIPENVLAQEYYYFKITFYTDYATLNVIKDIRIDGHLMIRIYNSYQLIKQNNQYVYDNKLYDFVLDVMYNKLYCKNSNKSLVFTKKNYAIDFFVP